MNTEAILAELQAERDRLSRAIAVLEGPRLPQPRRLKRRWRRTPWSVRPSNGKHTRPAAAPAMPAVRNGQFSGKTQPEAAKAFLEMVGHPLKTAEIVEGLLRGGVKIGGKTPAQKKQNLYAVLYKVHGLGRAGAGAWGVETWPGVKKNRNQKRKSAAK